MSVNSYIAQGTNPGAGVPQMRFNQQQASRNAFVQDRAFQENQNRYAQQSERQATADQMAFGQETLEILSGLPPEQRQEAYMARVEMAAATVGLPEGFDPVQGWQRTEAQLGPYMKPGADRLPAAPIQNWQFRNSLPEDQQPQFDTYVRAPLVTDVNQVPTMITPQGSQPLSTLEDETSAAGTVESGKAAAKQAIEMSGEALQQIPAIDKSLSNIDDAIAALDNGANTGVVYNMGPTFRQASLELQNVANRMGLDVVGAVTFGALSKGELDMAMATALPQGLKPDALRKWLVDRKEAQLKLRNELVNAAIFLGTPGNTPAMWAEKHIKNGNSVSDEEYERLKAKHLNQ